MDSKRTEQEEWVVRELNSSPIDLDVERKVGDPIRAALVDLLLDDSSV